MSLLTELASYIAAMNYKHQAPDGAKTLRCFLRRIHVNHIQTVFDHSRQERRRLLECGLRAGRDACLLGVGIMPGIEGKIDESRTNNPDDRDALHFV
jgi:hypothetical protein